MLREQIVSEASKIARTTEGATTPAQIPAFPHIYITWGTCKHSEMFAGFAKLTHAFKASIYAKGKGAEDQVESISSELIRSLASIPAWIRVKSTKAHRVPATEIFCTTIEAEAIEIKGAAEI